MFIAKNNDFITEIADTREELMQKLICREYTSIEETKDKYVEYDNQYVLKKDVKKLEEAKVAKLTMTALDLIKVLKEAGLTAEQIDAYLESNLEAKHQLMYCKDVYCEVVCSFLPIEFGDIKITKDMITKAYKAKYNL